MTIARPSDAGESVVPFRSLTVVLSLATGSVALRSYLPSATLAAMIVIIIIIIIIILHSAVSCRAQPASHKKKKEIIGKKKSYINKILMDMYICEKLQKQNNNWHNSCLINILKLQIIHP